MTDRFKGFVVTLENDVRQDDAQPLIDAIMHIKGVISVQPVVGNVNSDVLARRRARLEAMQIVLDAAHKLND